MKGKQGCLMQTSILNWPGHLSPRTLFRLHHQRTSGNGCPSWFPERTSGDGYPSWFPDELQRLAFAMNAVAGKMRRHFP